MKLFHIETTRFNLISSDLKLTKQVKTRSETEKPSQMEIHDKSSVNTDKDKTVGSYRKPLTHNVSAGLWLV